MHSCSLVSLLLSIGTPSVSIGLIHSMEVSSQNAHLAAVPFLNLACHAAMLMSLHAASQPTHSPLNPLPVLCQARLALSLLP